MEGPYKTLLETRDGDEVSRNRNGKGPDWDRWAGVEG
jgi:hypothetical protein